MRIGREMRIIENSEIIELKSCHNSGTFRMKDLWFLTEIVDMSDPHVFQDWSEHAVRMQFLFTAVFDIIGERQQVILAYPSIEEAKKNKEEIAEKWNDWLSLQKPL